MSSIAASGVPEESFRVAEEAILGPGTGFGRIWGLASAGREVQGGVLCRTRGTRAVAHTSEGTTQRDKTS